MYDRSPQISKPQARLTHDEVVEIFMARATKQSASQVCVRFGVSEKAVRDIWTGRTWAKETWHLDTSRSIEMKKLGRPLGRNDTKPRKQKIASRKGDDGDARGFVVQRSGIQAAQHGISPVVSCLSKFASQTGTSSTSDMRASESIDEELHELERSGQWGLVTFQGV